MERRGNDRDPYCCEPKPGSDRTPAELLGRGRQVGGGALEHRSFVHDFAQRAIMFVRATALFAQRQAA